MSYENTACPCGDKKECDTMLCAECLTTFASHPSMAAFNNQKLGVEVRRQSAIILVSLSRNRKRGAR